MGDMGRINTQEQAFFAEGTNITVGHCVSPSDSAGGTGKGWVKRATGSEWITGVALESVGTEGRPIRIQTEGVAECVAGAAIAVITSNEPTRVVSDSAGRVKTLPTTPSATYLVIGTVHPNSPAAAAANDRIWIQLNRDATYVVAV